MKITIETKDGKKARLVLTTGMMARIALLILDTAGVPANQAAGVTFQAERPETVKFTRQEGARV